MEEVVDTFWTNRKVLVTGGTGLVGGWLIKELLNRGALVSALVLDSEPSSELFRSGDSKKIAIISGNLSSYDDVSRLVSQSATETVFHLGAQTIVGTALLDPINTFKANIEGTWNLLESVRRVGSTISSVVVASSDKAYGTAKNLPYKENTPLHGDGPYDVSKSCTDLISQTYAKTYDLPVTIARCGNIYGGGDLNWSRIVPGTLKDIFHNRETVIRSDGLFVRDYIHVLDIVDAYLHLAEATEKLGIKGEAFNFSNDHPLTVLEMHKSIYKASGKNYREPVVHNTAKSEIPNQHLDSSKAKTVLGWNSKIQLQDGLRVTSEWYFKFLGEINR